MGEMKNLGCAIRDDSNAINTKSLLFLSLHGIMQKTKYPGVAQLVAHVIWVHGAERSNRSTRTKSPLEFSLQRASILFICLPKLSGTEYILWNFILH